MTYLLAASVIALNYSIFFVVYKLGYLRGYEDAADVYKEDK